jgi:uncharacterized membrane protein YgdD (TMEM256/DUF423 family)
MGNIGGKVAGETMMLVKIAGVLGFLGVALGAFGAHALRERLEAAGRMGTWETAVLYHLVHAAVILALALAGPRWNGPGWTMAAGVLVFSGSLYLLCLTGQTWLGAVTPLGGLLFLAGWGWVVLKAV